MAEGSGWLREHSFGLTLLALAVVWLTWTLSVGAEAKDVTSNLLGDTYGAALVVMLSKWLKERGSIESKDPEDD